MDISDFLSDDSSDAEEFSDFDNNIEDVNDDNDEWDPNKEFEDLDEMVDGSLNDISEELTADPIAKPEDDNIEDGEEWCEVNISDDATEAYITVHANKGKAVPVNLLIDALSKEKIKVGIKKEVLIRLASERGERKEEVLVAEGRKPKDGDDALIRYLFDIDPKPKGTINEDGRADFKETGILQVVEAGELLAIRKPPTDGVAGVTVTGLKISAKQGEDIFLDAGENTSFQNAERTKLIANVNGCAMVKKDTVSVSQLYIVQEDVDYDTGNIKFDGNVLIKGDVRSGFKVEATGDVEIKGVVEDAEVYCGGNCLVRGGTVGTGKGILKSAQNVFVRFVENQKVRAQGDVSVAEEVIYGDIVCGGDLQVKFGKGTIIGGTVMAGGSVEARTLGNIHYQKTSIESGYNKYLENWIEQIEKSDDQKEELGEKIQSAIQNLIQLKYRFGALDDENEAALQKLYSVNKHLDEYSKILEEKLVELNDLEAKNIKHAFVKVTEKINTGVKIIIADARWIVDEDIEGAGIYKYRNGKIEKMK